MSWSRAVLDLLAPLRCAACGGACAAEELTCAHCRRWLEEAGPLAGPGPPGIDAAWSAAPYEGVARALVVALKFRRLLSVADLMAERIGRLAPSHLLSGTIVPVPASRLRAMRRGFDPAAELAGALAQRLGIEAEPCLERRGVAHQLGRGRAERLSRPPSIRAQAAVPRSTLLVDDVLTTGATLTACARALREAGAVRVVAVTFTRRP